MELIERLVLALSREDDWVLDPFLGVGTAIVAAIRHNRRGVGAKIIKKYIDLAKGRIQKAITGVLLTRPMNKPIYDPHKAGNKLTIAPWKEQNPDSSKQMILLENKEEYLHEDC